MQGKCAYPIVSLKSEQAMTKEEIKEIAKEVVNNTIFCTKAMLTSDEAAAYMGISKSYLYKMTMRKEIPCYKPMGKVCYFDRAELEEWMRGNRASTDAEISQQAQNYCIKKGGAI